MGVSVSANYNKPKTVTDKDKKGISTQSKIEDINNDFKHKSKKDPEEIKKILEYFPTLGRLQGNRSDIHKITTHSNTFDKFITNGVLTKKLGVPLNILEVYYFDQNKNNTE